MRILVVITTAFVPYGGLTSVMMNYYRYICDENCTVDFASTNMVVDKALLIELEKRNSKYYGLGDRKKKLFLYIKNLDSILNNNHYDIIHVNSNSATAAIELAVAKKNGVNRRIVHNHNSICNHKIIHMLLKPYFKRLFTDAIACSNKAGDWIFGPENFSILNNSIDTNRYKFLESTRIEIRKKYDIANDIHLIGHVGKFTTPKNHLFLIDVFEEYHKLDKKSKLMLVGDGGEMRDEVINLVKSRGLEKEVIFAGMQSEVGKYLSAMDIFVFPSLWEGLPLSMIEAQSSGLFCCASNRIDASVVLTDTVKMIDLDEGKKVWALYIKKYVNQNEDRLSLSEENIKKIKEHHYDSETNVEALLSIYNGVNDRAMNEDCKNDYK